MENKSRMFTGFLSPHFFHTYNNILRILLRNSEGRWEGIATNRWAAQNTQKQHIDDDRWWRSETIHFNAYEENSYRFYTQTVCLSTESFLCPKLGVSLRSDVIRTTATRHEAVRETGVSRHHGAPIKAPPETFLNITAKLSRG